MTQGRPSLYYQSVVWSTVNHYALLCLFRTMTLGDFLKLELNILIILMLTIILFLQKYHPNISGLEAQEIAAQKAIRKKIFSPTNSLPPPVPHS